MSHFIKVQPLALVLFLTLGLSQAAAQKQVSYRADDVEEHIMYSGFLDNYTALQAIPGNREFLIFQTSDRALAPYAKFIIDPVIVHFHPDARGQGVDPDDLKRLCDYFRNALIKDLQKCPRCSVVRDPGPGVLRVRAAITDVIPAGRVAIPGEGLLLPRIKVGSVSVEVEMLDSLSGERVVAVVTYKQGRRFFANPAALITKWSDVKDAFDTWAKVFRDTLGQLQTPASVTDDRDTAAGRKCAERLEFKSF